MAKTKKRQRIERRLLQRIRRKVKIVDSGIHILTVQARNHLSERQFVSAWDAFANAGFGFRFRTPFKKFPGDRRFMWAKSLYDEERGKDLHICFSPTAAYMQKCGEAPNRHFEAKLIFRNTRHDKFTVKDVMRVLRAVKRRHDIGFNTLAHVEFHIDVVHDLIVRGYDVKLHGRMTRCGRALPEVSGHSEGSTRNQQGARAKEYRRPRGPRRYELQICRKLLAKRHRRRSIKGTLRLGPLVPLDTGTVLCIMRKSHWFIVAEQNPQRAKELHRKFIVWGPTETRKLMTPEERARFFRLCVQLRVRDVLGPALKSGHRNVQKQLNQGERVTP